MMRFSIFSPSSQFDFPRQQTTKILHDLLLGGGCGLAFLLLVLNYGFVLPDGMDSILRWGEFFVVCLFFSMAALEWIQAIRFRKAFLIPTIELALIGALLVEFVLLNIEYAGSRWTEARSFLLVQIYLISLQGYFVIVILKRAVRAGRRLFLLSFSPSATVSLSFLMAIALGTLVLLLPRSTHGELIPNISLIDALFTATSAVCVTGLTVADTATAFSREGQVIILALIQLGALGIMTYVGLFALSFGGRPSLQGRTVLQDLLTTDGRRRASSLLYVIFLTAFTCEAIGALLLLPGFYPHASSLADACFTSVFHSVSAFGNAGFSTFSNSLETFSASPIIVLILMALIVAGGIGFTVLDELALWAFSFVNRRIARPRLSLHTRLTLQMSGILLAGGFAAILLGGDWSGRNLGEILLSAGFQSVTTRTAGFNTIPLTQLAPWCLMFVMILMFIGGAPGGTAGGVKVTSAGLLFHAVRASIRGRRKVEIMHRTIAAEAVRMAFVICGLAVAYTACATIALTWAEPDIPFFNLLFEVISAFGTVGLTMNVTPELSTTGKIIIIITMYAGRVGPLTVFLSAIKKRDEALYSYPSGTIAVG